MCRQLRAAGAINTTALDCSPVGCGTCHSLIQHARMLLGCCCFHCLLGLLGPCLLGRPGLLGLLGHGLLGVSLLRGFSLGKLTFGPHHHSQLFKDKRIDLSLILVVRSDLIRAVSTLAGCSLLRW